MWHVSSRSGVATLRTAIHLLLTYLLESERIRALEAEREQRKTATIRSAACYPCQICGQTDVRRELDCTPTLARINTDYDPGSVVSTAQSNNLLTYPALHTKRAGMCQLASTCYSYQRPLSWMNETTMP